MHVAVAIQLSGATKKPFTSNRYRWRCYVMNPGTVMAMVVPPSMWAWGDSNVGLPQEVQNLFNSAVILLNYGHGVAGP